MATDQKRIDEAAAKYGSSVDHIAARYTNPKTGQKLTGEALIRKLIKGESGGNGKAVSSAGARGWAQFMPASRAEAIKKFGVDPWRSPEEAVKAATLHLRGKINGSTGLEGYNPGSPTYRDYILGQSVGAGTGTGAGGAVSSSTGGSSMPGATSSSSAFEGGSGLAAQLRAAVEAMSQDQGPAPLPSSGVAPPEFSAQPVMPEGYQQVPGSAPAPAAPAEDPVLSQLEAIARQAEATTFGGGEGPEPAGPGSAAGGGSGSAGGAGRPAKLRSGGGYKGTQGVAEGLSGIAWALGLSDEGSKKRHNTNPYSGSRSDHDVGNEDAYAIDNPWGSPSPTPQSDRAAFRMMRELGDTKYRMGQPIDTSRGVFEKVIDGHKYRIQVIYRGAGAAFGGNHLNHIHVGVKYLGKA